MRDPALVYVVQSIDDVMQQAACHGLGQPLVAADVAEQFSIRDMFHNEKYVVLCVNYLEKLGHRGVREPLENLDFAGDSLNVGWRLDALLH